MTAFWIIVIVGIFALLQVAYYNKNALKKVNYERYFSEKRVFAGEKVNLVEILGNSKLIPVPWVRVESRIPSELKFKAQENLEIALELFHKSLFFLGGYSRITRRHEITCTKRGYYDCSKASIAAGDLFGLATARRDYEGDAKLYVYPAIPRPEDMPDSALKWQGDVTVRRWIMPDPMLVNGIREYRPGDSRKDVHWGATARTGSLQVKTHDYTVSPRVLLCMNCQINDQLVGAMQPQDVEFLENGVNISAALAAWCCDNGIDAGFCSNGENRARHGETLYVAPGTGEAKLNEILEALAVLNIKMLKGFHATMDELINAGTTEMDIVIVSAYWSDSLETRAETLRKMNNSVSWVHIKGVLGR